MTFTLAMEMEKEGTVVCSKEAFTTDFDNLVYSTNAKNDDIIDMYGRHADQYEEV